MLRKFTSRKFLLGAGAFVALILATAGVIEQGTEVQVAEAFALILYIIVEGVIDAKRTG